MKPAVGPLVLLALAALSCAPSMDIESPADPPGIEKEDEKQQTDGAAPASGEAAVGTEAESETESESSE
jgi:hypothetical protein